MPQYRTQLSIKLNPYALIFKKLPKITGSKIRKCTELFSQNLVCQELPSKKAGLQRGLVACDVWLVKIFEGDGTTVSPSPF